MKVELTGTRNGQSWPSRGGEIDLPDQEAQDMIRAGMAEPLNVFGNDDPRAQARDALVPRRTMRL